MREGEKLRAKMQGEEASSEEEEATKEELLEDAEAMLREIDADKEQEHRGVFQCVCGAGVRRRMEFMKRAVERQRQEARQEAEQLIQALQEEKEFDEEEEKEEEPAENAAILSALAEGGVRRQKKKGKSLEVTEHIALGADRSASGASGASSASSVSTGPLFTAPVVPSVFGDAEAVGGSRLLEEISDAESEPEQPEQSEQPEEKAEQKSEQKAEETENPWLAAATDNVSHSAARRAEEKAEEAVDVQAALASLEQKAPAKRSREVVKGELGFEELGQSELLGMAFEDASAEKEFQEAKQKEVEQALEAAKPVVLDGWGSWAGIVGAWGASES